MSSLFRSKKDKVQPPAAPPAPGQPTPAGSALPVGQGTLWPALPGMHLPDRLSILPVRDQVLYPGTILPIFVEDPKLLQMVSTARNLQNLLSVFLVKNSTAKVTAENLHTVGTVALIHQVQPVSASGAMVVVQGIFKVSATQIFEQEGTLWAVLHQIPETEEKTAEVEALMKSALKLAQKVIGATPYLPKELQIALEDVKEPLKLAYQIVSLLRLKLEDKQSILELPNALEKLRKLTALLSKEVQITELGGKLTEDVQKEFAKFSREAYLRQQLKQIKKELGEKSESEEQAEEYHRQLKKLKLPREAEKEVRREIERLEKTSSWSPEAQVIRTYLDWTLSLPWRIETKDNLSVERAKRILDKDHYGLKDVKERILEYLAVRKLKPEGRGPILCLVGPPGVGKTSLGQSIAKVLGRKFARISLGGMRDEAEIRGHRRTYIGALPGRIIQGVKRAQSKNPVFMLDEIDKVGTDFRGDPSSALLEVLDPEQNKTFRDHYLDLDFDLSKTFFITTANITDTIQPALRDRMEVIRIPGYTVEEKIKIAKGYLIPKVLQEQGIRRYQLKFEESALRKIIEEYTLEAGVRNLERQLAKISRRVAKRLVSDKQLKVTVTGQTVSRYLGPQKVFPETQRVVWEPGVATGLAWTQAGGTIQFVEATTMPGKRGFLLTGQLGDVMKESAQTALSLVRSRAKDLGIAEKFFEKTDVHIHVPEGAIPKDGPSAGVTMTTALVSLLTQRLVRKDLAMTGEVTLSGLVLPIGGVKEKVLAAKRAGLTTVILPKRNEGDLKEIEPELKEGLKFIFVENIEDVLKNALQDR